MIIKVLLEKSPQKTSVCLLLMFILSVGTSCRSSKINTTDQIYFKDGPQSTVLPRNGAAIKMNDLLDIHVSSSTSNQEQTDIFNMRVTPDNFRNGYKVDSTGNIVMPVIGKIKAEDLTIDELQSVIDRKLSPFVKNPLVRVRFLAFNVNVLGEVRNPGIQKFYTDRVTIIDALATAGDLTDFGRRDNIILLRTESGKIVEYKIDLRTKTVFQSPMYMLQPNDIVYVQPNKFKLINLGMDPEKQRKTNLLFSITSIVLAVIGLVVFSVR